MAFTVTVTAFQLTPTETWTYAKFNQGFNPTVAVTGAFADLSNFNTVSSVSKTFTVLSVTDDTLTATAHGLNAPSTVDDVTRAVVSNSGGALPGGLTASTSYFYYVRVVDANTLTLHKTAAGALANTERVDITSAGTGTQTITWTLRDLGETLIFDAGTSKYEHGVVGRAGLPEMIGATSSANGARGAVPQPSSGDESKALFGDGTWRDPTTATNTASDLFLNRNSF